MTTRHTAAAALTCMFLLAACGGGGQAEPDGTAADAPGAGATTQEQASPPAPDERTSTDDVARIPDGRYVRVATAADAEGLELTPEQVDEFLGRDGELPIALEFEGSRWMHYMTNDAGVEELGDLGTTAYPEEGQLVTTSTSTGCQGCVRTIEWSLEGSDLVLEPVDLLPDEAFHTGGRWTREGG